MVHPFLQHSARSAAAPSLQVLPVLCCCCNAAMTSPPLLPAEFTSPAEAWVSARLQTAALHCQ
mgnify:CR=1 FL=1